jgi:predicted DNA-binding transcriptional regulator YafY
MNPVIAQAILEKRRLRFSYHGRTRLVEPQCYGLGSQGTELLRAHQLEGGAQREPLFDVSKMQDLVLLDEVFARAGPHYKRNDSAMKLIFCQL